MLNTAKIIQTMRNIVADVMTSFKTDFENYDRPYIEQAATEQFPMIWIVGKSHTNLLQLGAFRNSFFGREDVRYRYAQGDDGFSGYLEPLNNDKVFLITADDINQISKKQACEIIRDITLPVVNEWTAKNGGLPDDTRMTVILSGISLSKLKELIHDCQAHGDNSLLKALKGFRQRMKLGADHYIQVTYHSSYNEFGFCEYLNGTPRINGGIVFHGWPETGYKTNGSVQISPSYGWSKHT